MKILFIVFVFILTAFFLAYGEEIQMLSGKVYEGPVIERDEKSVTINVSAGIPITLYFDEVKSIDGVNINEAKKKTDTEKIVSEERINIVSDSKSYPDESADSIFQIGNNYLKQNKLDEAIVAFSKAIELSPRSDEVFYSRGRAYAARGDLDLALEDYSQAIGMNLPTTIQAAYNNRGLIYVAKGDLDRAIEDYTKGIEAMPNPMFSKFRYAKQVLYRNRALAYASKGEFEKASEDVQSIEKTGGSVEPELIEKIRTRDSNVRTMVTPNKNSEKYPGALSEVSFYNSRGYKSFKERKYDLAIEDYTRALEIDPNEAIVYDNRANAYCAQKKYLEAIADYKRSLEINPKDEWVYHDLGLTYVNINDFEKAVYYYNKAFEVNPKIENDGQFRNDRAVAYFFLKDYDKSWEDVNKAIELGFQVHPQFLRALKKTTGKEEGFSFSPIILGILSALAVVWIYSLINSK